MAQHPFVHGSEQPLISPRRNSENGVWRLNVPKVKTNNFSTVYTVWTTTLVPAIHSFVPLRFRFPRDQFLEWKPMLVRVKNFMQLTYLN
jgi:hypothetical protein